MKVKQCILASSFVFATSCTSFGAHRMFEDSDAGFVMLAGDAEGIRAYNDGLIGHIEQGKATADKKTAYWQTREQETQVRGLKFRVNKGGAK
jgi:hypothetical protein